jgi:hypothetical protein
MPAARLEGTTRGASSQDRRQAGERAPLAADVGTVVVGGTRCQA